MPSAPSVSVVIVSFDSAAALERTLPALAGELQAGDEVIVVDNGSADGSVEVARRHATVIESGANLGFPAASNLGASRAAGDLLVFLNPDAVPQPGWGAAIRRPWAGPWVAWQGLVTTEGGRLVNTAGNVLHFTGISWAGDAGAPVAERHEGRREVAVVSGACLAVRARAFGEVGGFAEDFFLYHEDTDLSLRLRLVGGRLGIEPEARVDHDYEFVKGAYKWRLLERNRWATLIRCWPGRLLAVTLPALLATELAVWAAALAGGWAPEKARATDELLRSLPRLLRERRSVQATRRVAVAEFAGHLTAELTSPFLGPVTRVRILQAALRTYWALARRLMH